MPRTLTLLAGCLLVLQVACGGSSLGDCPPDSTETSMRGAQVVRDRCLGCHNSQITGPARQGAPGALNFDRIEVVREEADWIYSEVSEGRMPPTGRIAGAEVADLRVWLACGAP